MQSDITQKNLIRKYINQDCSPEELEDMKKLMLLPGTQQLFDEVLAESWTGLVQEKDIDQPILNERLKDFYQRLETEEGSALQKTNSEQTVIRKIKRRNYLQYAAVLALFIFSFATYSLLKFKKTPVQGLAVLRQVVNANGQRSTVTLPDNSEVFLGAGSKLVFPDKFAAGSREVKLEGEAFFQVTKNPKRPFIIHTGNVQTRVLGTSFKIEAFKNRPVTVAVATGKVRVDEYTGHLVKSLAILTPGQQVTCLMGNAIISKTVIDNVKAWKDGRLVFNKRTLQDITAELERWYDVKIIYKNKAKAEEELSVVLQASVPLRKIMEVLSATGHFHYKINEKNITIN
ncbi:ferric-dicitrate binding protein FerR (iron transport regulator) [Pedobacter cryoconitis]|uniref:FecR family protein n=1 Tax=Pedobacter cryoconitis TaxID=188932 RepID=UPI00161F9E4A|nr:FecR family protein [Pedobacter cryoconitis]MBB6272953.1 ferric-dicitrate binding protein FerR (iron transport regulator) [Pedobacter cryoconitis]